MGCTLFLGLAFVGVARGARHGIHMADALDGSNMLGAVCLSRLVLPQCPDVGDGRVSAEGA
eukprot:2237431-Prymnesium_polylepis.2